MPVMLQAGDASVRGAEWGEMRVVLVSVPAGTDFSPLLRGLPSDRCQCPHWGYVLKGRLRIQYAGSEEVISGGDFYYLPPDHTGIAEEDTDFLELAPPGLHQQFLDAAAANLEAMTSQAT
jgi:hypothetical protein